MNYFAHGFAILAQDQDNADPYFLAGTAVPDWMNVVNRRTRVRSKTAREYSDHPDLELAAFARGAIRHHHDDDWFHQTRSFHELSTRFTLEIRDLLAPDPGFRPSFLGHILVELLLDAELIRLYPERIESYYEVLARAERDSIEKWVEEISGRGAKGLAWMIEKFLEIRFLYDYSDSEKLLGRLNQIMHRVKLSPLPDRLLGFLDSARIEVKKQTRSLFLDHVES